ncbi:hypothetical protein MATL_G00192340 [Megalops atlanticus]|uniref:Uncharacterized protein n=1 Tax=Megalops atlanticus TaxID=7932 RepID=A0A9D3T0N2_MEGAT|nr:hypothetical protein MATL_G00192340 [Megalops atlanticus]
MELANGFLTGVNGSHLSWDNTGFTDPLPNKRKRSYAGNDGANGNGCMCEENEGQKNFEVQGTIRKQRSCFVPIDGNRGVYYSECWEPNGSTLYLPVNGSLLANMDKYDQISFEQGFFCIGEESGGFQQKAQGQAIHCWRYSEQEKKLFIALSYFFTSFHVFQDVVSSLGGL